MAQIEVIQPPSCVCETCKKFVHLHLHTTYSLLDGAQQIGDLENPKKEMGVLNVVKNLGMDAVAITDHGNMFGVLDFYKKAKKGGLKPILGCEVYIAPGDRRDKSVKDEQKSSYHLLLLAKDLEGYRNLCRLVSIGHFEGFYYKPRIDKEVLRKYSKGLIGTSACLSGEISQQLLRNRHDEARRLAKEYQEIFNGDFYIELQMTGIKQQHEINPHLAAIAKDLQLPLVATNDVHYMTQEDAKAQDVLMAIQTKKLVKDQNRMKHEVDEFYIKSPEMMWELFKDYPEACENTVKIAEMCNVDLPLGKYFFPRLPTAVGRSSEEILREMAFRFMEDRLKPILRHKPEDTHDALRKTYFERLDFELKVIQKMGFSDYFLIVSDFINWAKNKDIPVGPGRGSAAGSIAAYALRITDIDPVEHNLLFERFLNPERVSMPDIDVDFCEARRDEVIDYVRDRYKIDEGPSVAQIITFGKLKAKAVLRDVARTMDFPTSEGDRLSKLIPNVLNITLEQAIQQEPRLEEEIKKNKAIADVFDIAKRLEGLNRHASIHAAGVVISDGRPLFDHVPLYKGANGEVVTQFDMKGVETIGLIKFDFLGLKNLTLIKDCLRLIKETRGEVIDLAAIPLNDKPAYDLLCEADTLGVFQLESSGMRQLITRLRPSCFEDVVALVALYRPGPLKSGMADSFIRRKHGEEEIDYPFDCLKPILESTYGVCIYQEQVMQIANVLCSYSLGEADLLRRAMGKKDANEMAKQRDRFLQGAEKNHHDGEEASKLFSSIEKFAEYGFNRCLVGKTTIVDAHSGEPTTIGELFQNKRPFFIHALGDDWKLRPRRVTDVFSNGIRPVFRLQTALGLSIVATANHPFRTLEGWTLLGDLHPGVRIAAPRSLPVLTQTAWPKYQLVTLAALLSEGNTCHPSSLYVYNKNEEFINDFIESVQQFPHTKARIHQRRGVFEVCVNTGKPFRFGSQRTGSYRWLASDGNAALSWEYDESLPVRSGVYTWVQELGLIGCKATQKRTPKHIFCLRDDDIAFFLGRLWSGDGFLFGSRKTDTPFYATSSRQLAQDVRLLLLRLNIPTVLKEKKFRYNGGIKLGYTVSVVGEDSKENFYQMLAPHMIGREKPRQKLQEYLHTRKKNSSSKDTIPVEIRKKISDEKKKTSLSWKEIESELGISTKDLVGKGSLQKKGFRRSTIQSLASFFRSEELLHLSSSDVFWDTIVSIEPCGEEETYDLTVEEDHNFVADGLLVHNSHSAAYGYIAYQTAWLKAHYRQEYMAALLTADAGNSDKILLYMNDCRTHEVMILPPNVNLSEKSFSVKDGAIVFGLSGVKNVGEAAIDTILQARSQGRPFENLCDFVERIGPKSLNRRVYESLIKCGAFDHFKVPRAIIESSLDKLFEYALFFQKEKESSQISLFGSVDTASTRPILPEGPEWPEKERLSHEKEALGFYITGHPLSRYQSDLSRFTSTTIAELADQQNASEQSIAGIISARRDTMTKKGDRMSILTLEDLTGSVEVSVFPRVYAQAVSLLDQDVPLLIRGEVEIDENNVRFKSSDIRSLLEARVQKMKEIHIRITASDLSEKRVTEMKKLFDEFTGNCSTYLHIRIPRRSKTVVFLEDIRLSPSEGLVEQLERLFGAGPVYFR